jgi:hypothetical protein
MGPKAAVRLEQKSFFKRHSRAVSVVGFVIVLLTWAVKEVFQDQLKELRDSISEAQRAEDLGDQRYASSIDQLKVNMRLATLRNQIAAQQIGGPPAKGDLSEEVSEVFLALSNEEIHFNQLSDTLDKLPGNTEALKQERDQLRSKLENTKTEIHDTAAKAVAAKTPNVANDILVMLGIIKIFIFDLEVIPLQEAVAESAKRVKEAAERRYKECTYAGWLLFILGWAFGLGGAIYGWKPAE